MKGFLKKSGNVNIFIQFMNSSDAEYLVVQVMLITRIEIWKVEPTQKQQVSKRFPFVSYKISLILIHTLIITLGS